MKLSTYFLKRPTLFWSLMVAIILGGIGSYMAMPKLEDPAIQVKQATIIAQFPGASAHEVELQVTTVLEQEVQAMPQVKEMTSVSKDGLARVNVTMKDEVPQSEIQQRWDLLRRKMGDIAVKLPRGCSKPIVLDDVSDVYGMFYSITANGYDYPELYKWTDKLKQELLAMKGVRRVDIQGDPQECIDITLTKEQVARNGYLPTQIMAGLQGATESVAAGTFRSSDQEIPFRVESKVQSVEDVQNLLINSLDKQQMRLADIAKINRTYTYPQTNGIWVNNRPALALMVEAEEDANVANLGDDLDKRMEELKTELPAGFQVDKIFYQPTLVKSAVNGFIINLLESVLIVILVLMFTMGIRPGMIIGAGLVLTIAASFPILLVMGTTLQRISLGAFIIAMGMLVDNSIVIMDGILVDKQRGLSPKKYLFNICNKTAMPLLGATIIASVTFIEVYLATGTASEYASDLFLVITVSLLISWVLALTQVPMFSKSFLPVRAKKQKLNSKGEVQVNGFTRTMQDIITWVVNWKKITVALAVCVFCLAIWGFGFVKNLFFPDCNYDQFVVEYYLPAGTSAEKTKEDLKDMTDLLLKNSDIKNVVTFQGGAPARYCLLRPMGPGGENYGELLINCEDYEGICKAIPVVRKQLRELHPEAYIRTRKYNFSISTSHTVEVQFSGPDPAVLRQLSSEAEAIMRQCPYADSLSVNNDWAFNSKSLYACYNQQNGRSAGIDRSDVGKSLQAVGLGLTGGAIYETNRIIPINLKIRNADGSRIKDVQDIPVFTTMPNAQFDNGDIQGIMSGSLKASDIQDHMFACVPLSAVTDSIMLGWDEGAVMRYNGRRAIEAQCDPNFDDGYTAANCVNWIKPKLSSISLPHGYTMQWLGEEKNQKESSGVIVSFMPLIMAIILAVLLVLFGNWKKVGIILSCLPFVIVGISPALALSGQPFTFMALIGIMGLIGMMVKNSIVLVDEVTRLTNQGEHPYNALITATVSRIRPVTMASLTTILGMIPLFGDPMYFSMAITIMSGLTAGTVITLLLLPAVYALLFHIRKPIKN